MAIAVDIAGLMAGIARKDPKALEEMYLRFSKALYNVIFSIVRRREDAEEILGDVFHQAWEKASTYDDAKGSAYTWLLSLSRNRAIDRLRSKGYKAETRSSDGGEAVEELPGSEGVSPLDQVVLSERADLVRGALPRISPDQRRILEIAYFEGLTQSEVAERLEIPLGTVKSRMRDGMKALQGLLEGMV
jgi:RNA polymerase sigma-70 factor (ECF subfamily)